MAIPTDETGYSANTGNGWWTAPDEEETPELRWPLNIEVYDRMRRQDAQVISVLRAVTLPVRRTDWWIDPNGARPEVVDFVADNLGLPIKGQAPKPVLRTRDRFSWAEHLRLALLMLPFGHSPFEQVYRIDEAGRARLRKLAWRPPRTISKVEVAADGGLVALEQASTTAAKTARMGVERLVVYVHDREGGNWLGQSLLRPAYKFWLLKDRILRVQAQTVDRNGMGVPVYTASEVPASLAETDLQEYTRRQTEEIKRGEEIARGFRSGNTSGAAIPNGAKLELLGVQGTLPDADKPIRYYDEQIARAVLAHFLNLGTETGSWALGSTFADFFTLSLQTIANDIADVATQHVVEDLVDINFGESEPAPRVTFDEIGSRSPATAESIKALIDCGAITPDEALEAELRQKFGLPAAPSAPAGEVPDPRDVKAARDAAETVQKVYLGVGPLLSQAEARRVVERAGVELIAPPDPVAPPADPTTDDPTEEP
jgi:hypothetical protein